MKDKARDYKEECNKERKTNNLWPWEIMLPQDLRDVEIERENEEKYKPVSKGYPRF